MFSRVLLSSVVLTAACASAPPVGPEAKVLNDIAKRVYKLRKLTPKEAIAIEATPPESFSARHLMPSADDPARNEQERAIWRAFGFVHPGDPNDSPVLAQLAGGGSKAYYDVARRRILSPGELKVADVAEEGGVAHELMHALQDRQFGLNHLLGASDEAIAAQALYEGEAMVVMFGYIADRNNKPAETAMLKAGGQLARLNVDARASTGPEALLPLLVREQLQFRTLGGARFVSHLFARGGFAAIDRMYKDPPTSTEQLLHPDHYLAGDRALPVADPTAPDGWKTIATGTLGELGIDALLRNCAGGRDMTRAAEGWGGDRFAVIQAGEQLALLWSTAWDSEPDAARFEANLKLQSACWRDVPNGVERTFAIKRDKHKVAFVRGLPVDKQPLDALLRLPQAAGALRPPLPELAPKPVDKELAHVEGTRFVSKLWGLEAHLPADWKYRAASPVLITAERLQLGDKGRVEVSVAVIEKEKPVQLMPTLGKLVQRRVGNRKVTTNNAIEVDLGWGKLESQTFAVHLPVRHFRYRIAPLCEGAATLLLYAEWQTDDDLAIIDRWERSFKVKDSAQGCINGPGLDETGDSSAGAE